MQLPSMPTAFAPLSGNGLSGPVPQRAETPSVVGGACYLVDMLAALAQCRHDFSREGSHPGHEVFNGRAEVGADVLRPGLLEGVDFREDGLRVAGECRAGTQFDAATIREASHLLGFDAEILRLQPRRLPHIPERPGASQRGVGCAADEDGEPFALRRRRSEVALVVAIELPVERSLRA